MYEGLRSPNIHTPKNLGEYSSIIQHYPLSTLWAGGTYIMSRKDSYPSKSTNNEIIYLGEVEDLHRFQRNDRLAEFGSMVTMDEILSAGKTILPKVLIDNIKALGGQIICSRITIGGSIATEDFRTSIPATLSILDTSCEVRFFRKKRMHAKWMPILHLFDKTGKLNLPQQALISKIRINLNQRSYQFFREEGSIMTDSGNAVALSFICNPEQDVVNDARFAVTYPNLGFLCSRDLDNLFTSVRFPLDRTESASFEEALIANIATTFAKASELQKARTRGMLREIVSDLNMRALTNPVSDAKVTI